MIYVRWRRGASRRCRSFPPLPADHPSVDHPCPGCGLSLGTVASVQLIAVGPVDPDVGEPGRGGGVVTPGHQ